ncbi:hypothetical protein [Endomicrobium proavitum]|uniref:Outer membrane protein beta-barrel domain-containing protein n=1 Tax=Endomicrobium proavitum TaxID=1408281 RepID=A0A0G3WHK8_9BACT|nr:hypothetical protein [Endomicrobium proavitum]AKL97813.1 exported protein of unknown function [Endomicrobium proavitum]
MKKALFALVLVFAAANVFADNLYLNNGEVLDGKIIQETADSYLFQQGSSWKQIKKTDVTFAGNVAANNSSGIPDIDLILKLGTDLSGKTFLGSKNDVGTLYDKPKQFHIALELDFKAFKNIYLGFGAGINPSTNLDGKAVYYTDIPYYLIAKFKQSIGENKNVYVSGNIGSHSLTFKGSPGVDPGYDVSNKMPLYYGINAGVELSDLILELAFLSSMGELSSEEANTGGWGVVRNSYDFLSQSVVFSIGYKIF